MMMPIHNRIQRAVLLCLCTPLLFLGCGEQAKDTLRSGEGPSAGENSAGPAGSQGANTPGQPSGTRTTNPPSDQPVPVERPPNATDTPPPSGNTGEQPAAEPTHHFVLRLEEGESTAELAQVQVHLAVEPADADLTRKGVRTALLELEHSGNLVVPEPFFYAPPPNQPRPSCRLACQQLKRTTDKQGLRKNYDEEKEILRILNIISI